MQDAETISRIQIDISLSHHNVLYAVIYEPGEGFYDSKTRVYRTINIGQLWTRINNYGNLGGNYGSGWMDQGYYDLCIAIDPNTPYHVFIGNIELHETTDGDHFEPLRPYGSNAWKSIAHVDYHKLVFAPSNPDYLYIGCDDGLYKSDDGGGTFQMIASNVAPHWISDMVQSQVNPDHMILCTGFGDIPENDTVILVKISTDDGEIWEDVSNNIQGEERWISRVKTDPIDENTIYVVRTGFSEGNKIYKTTDLGQTWANISGNLPDLPTNDLFIDPENASNLYAANDIGVYLSTNGGLNWEYASEEIPFVPVFDFDYRDLADGKYLRAGTYGRSIYEANLLYVGKEENKPQDQFTAINVQNYPNPFNGSTTIDYELAEKSDITIMVYDQMGKKVDEMKVLNVEKGKHQFTWQPAELSPGVYYFRIIQKNDRATGKIVKMH